MSAVAKRLSKRHLRELEEGSGISQEIIKARGYRTVKETDDLLRLGFARAQLRVPGLLIPTQDAAGAVVAHQYKPDEPRLVDGKTVKYETPKGSQVRLGIPPGAAAKLPDPTVPLWITEGAKKADAAVTAGLCCISLQGVDCWRRDGEPLKDWEQIAKSGREMFAAYDSDVMIKPEVQSALDELTHFLRAQGARVSWVVLPPKPGIAGDEKVGLDDWLVANEMDPSGLAEFVMVPEINIRANDVPLPRITRQSIAALHSTNDPKRLFARDDLLVEARGIGVQEVSKDRLTFLLGESAHWYRVTKHGRRDAVPPPNVVTNVLAAGQELWSFDYLDRIVTTPVFARDGSLRTKPGYHGPSRSYYLPPEDLDVPTVSANPKKSEIKQAKALIDELLQDFAFVDDADRAHAWAMLLQPFARELIWGPTPLFSVQAPKQGTGKTLLVQSAFAPSAGDVDSFAEPHGDEEMEKRLTSVLREAAPVVFFDNVDRTIVYPSLASALTKPTWSGRVLGKSATVTMPIQCSFVLTANNPQFSEDLKRRVVPIRLDALVEDPSQRTNFTLSLPAWALDHRAELVWAACTIIAAWVAQPEGQRPRPPEDTPTLGSYGAWRTVLGGILTHAKVPGFLQNLHTKAADRAPDVETFEAICVHAIEKFGSGEPWYVSQLAESLYLNDIELALGRRYRDGVELTPVLADFLKRRKGQIINGHRLERSDKRRGPGFAWRFQPVEATK